MPKRGCTGYREIAERLRGEWLARWQPGLRLPTYLEMCQRFGTTPVTMQRAMGLLVEQGYVVTRPPVGAFLAERPPPECQVGLIFPGHPQAIVNYNWSLNYLANLRVAEEINASSQPWKIRFYMDLSAEAGSKGLAKLLRDIDDRVIGGLIFNYSPHDLKTHPLIARPPLPVVHYNPDFAAPGMGIRTQIAPFIRAALTRLGQRGLAEIGVLAPMDKGLSVIREEFRAQGIACRPEWVLASSPYHPEWVATAIAAMFRPDGRPRPEALVITDDHLVEPAVAALLELNPPGLDRLVVFAHWNFPLPYHGRLPIVRFGYDAHAWLGAALELIARHPEPSRAKGEVVTIPPRLVEGAAGPAPASSRPAIHTLVHQAKEILQCAAN